jgi:hypothetical protein
MIFREQRAEFADQQVEFKMQMQSGTWMAGPSPAEGWSRKAAEEFRFGPQAGTRPAMTIEYVRCRIRHARASAAMTMRSK